MEYVAYLYKDRDSDYGVRLSEIGAMGVNLP